MEILFKRYYSYLCKLVYRILPRDMLVEDLVQEVFSTLWQRRSALDIEQSVKGYLRRTAINKTLNHIRDNKIKIEADSQLWLDRQSGDRRPVAMEYTELKRAVEQAIDTLPERCRLVFILSRFDDMTYAEIATALGISEKTVENQISKALRVLRTALSAYLPKSG